MPALCRGVPAWRVSLLPGAGPGLTHLPAGTAGVSSRDKGVIPVPSVCWTWSDSQPGHLRLGSAVAESEVVDPGCDARYANTTTSALSSRA